MSADELPSYDPATPCVKCGFEGPADTQFLLTGHCVHPDRVIENGAVNERQHRTCRRCGFQWDEAPVDRVAHDC